MIMLWWSFPYIAIDFWFGIVTPQQSAEILPFPKKIYPPHKNSINPAIK